MGGIVAILAIVLMVVAGVSSIDKADPVPEKAHVRKDGRYGENTTGGGS